MFSKQNFKLSDSLVLKELEKIGREKGLIAEPKEEFYVPEIKKQASEKKLAQTGDILLDSIALAKVLESKGYIKQAEILVEKALKLKEKMSQTGHDTLYNFWNETGEALENAAHPQKNDIEGRSVPNLNEAQQAIHSTLQHEPTGDVKKASLMATMFEMVVKEAQEEKDYVVKLTNAYNSWYPDSGKFYVEKIKPLIDKKFLSDDLNWGSQNPASWFDEKAKNNEQDELKAFEYINPAVNKYLVFCNGMGNDEMKINAVLNSDIAMATRILSSVPAENWDGTIFNFAKMWTFSAAMGTLSQFVGTLADPTGLGVLPAAGVPKELTQTKGVTPDFIKSNNIGYRNWTITGLSSLGKTAQKIKEQLLNSKNIQGNISNVIRTYKKHSEEFTEAVDDFKAIRELATAGTNIIKEALGYLPKDHQDYDRVSNTLRSMVELSKMNMQQNREALNDKIKEIFGKENYNDLSSGRESLENVIRKLEILKDMYKNQFGNKGNK